MTICVAVKVNDCLVFAADSATTLTMSATDGRATIANVYRHSNKVFNLFRGLPVCAMTCGMGNIGRKSISTIAKDLRLRLEPGGQQALNVENYTIQDVAERSREYLYEECFKRLESPPAIPHSLEFYVGGYGSNDHNSEVWQIFISNGECGPPKLMQGADNFGAFAMGQPEAVNRLTIGYSHHLPAALLEAGLKPEEIGKLIGVVASRAIGEMCPPAMPVQDAIILAEYLVDTTKGFVRFQPGADIVGGDTDIATVTKHEGFKWIQRKHYYSAGLNRLETDHVQNTQGRGSEDPSPTNNAAGADG